MAGQLLEKSFPLVSILRNIVTKFLTEDFYDNTFLVQVVFTALVIFNGLSVG